MKGDIMVKMFRVVYFYNKFLVYDTYFFWKYNRIVIYDLIYFVKKFIFKYNNVFEFVTVIFYIFFF